ncbi:aquaporin-8 isoform X1 [Centrocercus urophasianus]|uniref:aquaporin-8 isoform X1 n=1 Tax=Centrocercus urophasianus TaxID=9002 RepID=UPI001C6485AC|nr:aquaporin-8 isoform X1 [Centrocercus urophasianus]
MEMVDSERPPAKKNWYERYVLPFFSELLGTAAFVFIGCMSVVEDSGATGTLQPALVHGLSIVPIVVSLENISGSHTNPVVSLAIWLIGKMEHIMVIPYIIAQLCGGILGAALTKAVANSGSFDSSHGGAFGVIQGNEQIGAALGNEIITTTFLLLVVCMTAVNAETKSHLAPVSIALTVVINVMVGGSVSGPCMNPARAFGPAVIANYWLYHWVYWVGPVIGCLICSILMRFVIGGREIRLFLK